jgi:hypothetical protein
MKSIQSPIHKDLKMIHSFYKWFQNNSLSIVFFSFFIIFIILQSITGFHAYNGTLAAFGRSTMGFKSYLSTGNFLDGVFANWQAAILQLLCLILFTSVFHQKGASHSLKPGIAAEEKREKEKQEDKQVSWIFRHSFSLAFILIFIGSFIAHIVFGSRSFNETSALSGSAPISIASFMRTGTFWFTTMQTWQAEFVSIGLFLVLSIFLRQEGSAESKPVKSSNEETGNANK